MGSFSDKLIVAETAVQPGDKTAGVSAVVELLKRNNIDPAEIGRVQRVSVWQGMSKDEDGNPQVTDLIGVQLSPTWEDGPEWEPVRPAAVYGHKAKDVVCNTCLNQLRVIQKDLLHTKISASHVTDADVTGKGAGKKSTAKANQSDGVPSESESGHLESTISPSTTLIASLLSKEGYAAYVGLMSRVEAELGMSTTTMPAAQGPRGRAENACVVCCVPVVMSGSAGTKGSTKKTSRSTSTENGEYHRTVLFPDPQIGYWRNLDNGELNPIHDEEAMAVALNIAKAVQPDRIVHLGDFLDLAEFGRFATEPELAFTTQESLNRGHRFLAECRAILGPDGDLALIAGNHDHRLSKMVTKNAMAALRLKRADAPDTWPVMSVPYLLALDSLNCEYVDGYPAGSYKLADGTETQTPLYAVHERGLDVVKVAKQQRQSYVQGHTHRVAMHSETYELNGMPIEVEAWSLGSLCRRDGAVPSFKSGASDRGSVVRRIESWQHAVAVVTVAPDGSWSVEPIRIRDGKAHYGGKVYTAD